MQMSSVFGAFLDAIQHGTLNTRRKYQLMGMVLDSLYLKKELSKWLDLIKGLIGLKF